MLEVALSMNELRKRSGNVDSDDPLVAFLYGLLRDHLPAGKVEEIMQQHVGTRPRQVSQYTNGWVANYAQDIANRLRQGE